MDFLVTDNSPNMCSRRHPQRPIQLSGVVEVQLQDDDLCQRVGKCVADPGLTLRSELPEIALARFSDSVEVRIGGKIENPLVETSSSTFPIWSTHVYRIKSRFG
jgi:hypothetical protein